jgi:hypothetical protein
MNSELGTDDLEPEEGTFPSHSYEGEQSDDGFGQAEELQYEFSDDDSWVTVQPDRSQKLVSDAASSACLNLAWCRSVEEAHLSLRPNLPLLPHERGFAAQVFGFHGIQSTMLHRRTTFPSCMSVTESPKPEANLHDIKVPVAAWKVAKKRISGMQWKDVMESKRAYVLQKWKHIICISPRHTDIGALLLKDIMLLSDDANLSRTLQDVFSGKSTATLNKRASHLQKFSVWCKRNNYKPIPVEENTVYMYLYSNPRMSSTTPQSFRESLHFAGGVIGLHGAIAAADSPRVKGFADRMRANKRPLSQSPPLSVKQVRQLEHVLYEAPDIQDSLFAGHCLFCILARSRWGDSQSLTGMVEDVNEDGEGFLQLATRMTKTSSSAEKKATFLPMVAITPSITESPWHSRWIEVRRQCGLSEFREFSPAMPEILNNGKLGLMPLSTGNASKWLRQLLDVQKTGSSAAVISTHSLKRTVLSWAAKYGISREERSILGYHVIPGLSTMLHYSVDEQVTPLKRLHEMFRDIRSGDFNPDQTRTALFKRPDKAESDLMRPTSKARATPPTDQLEEAPSSSEDPSSSGESSSDLSENEELAKAIASDEEGATRRVRPARVFEFSYALHKRWKTLHKVPLLAVEKSACGRVLNDTYIIFEDAPKFCYHKCVTCFGSV